MAGAIIRFIDFFYFPFLRFLPKETFRYAVAGGANVVLDLLLYFTFYNFIFAKNNVDLLFVVMSPHIASLFFVFPITFTTGFLLNRFVSFPDSNLHWRIQVFRYFMVGMGALILSYLLMKLFVDVLHFYPTPSRLISVILVILYSYFSQRKYSFRVLD